MQALADVRRRHGGVDARSRRALKPANFRRRSVCILAAVAAAASARAVSAQTNLVTNPGFETPVSTDGGGGNVASPWVFTGNAGGGGAANPNNSTFPNSTDTGSNGGVLPSPAGGQQTGFVQAGGATMYQSLGNIVANDDYSVSLAIGSRTDLTFPNQFYIYLREGSQTGPVLAAAYLGSAGTASGSGFAGAVAGVTPASGTFALTTFNASSAIATPYAGQPLYITMLSGGTLGASQTLVDNVSVIATPNVTNYNYNWNTTTGLFTTGSNWDQGTAPGNVSTDIAYINNGGTAQVVTGNSISLLNLFVGSIGATKSGHITHSDGSLTVGSNLEVGYNGGSGTYNLGGGTLTTSNLYVGDGSPTSTGTFTQTAGALTASSSIYIGRNTATGSFSLTGGNISAGNLYAGNGGTGVLNISGAATNISVGGQFWAGNGNGSIGVINQSAGTVTVVPGITSIGGALTAGSSGTHILSGGTFNASGATLNSSPLLIYGQGGNATLMQTGGTLLTSGPFELGGASATGVATFVGGTASIDQSGFMTIAGGQGSVAIGAIGTGYMNMGTVGQTGAGAIVSTGANSGNSTVYVGFPSGVNSATTSNGTLSLNCGVLQINSSTGVTTFGSTGQVNLNGGTIRAGQANENLIASATGLTATVYPGGAVLDTNGFSALITQPLVGAAGNGVYGTGGAIAISSNPGGTAVIGLPIVKVSTTGSGTGLTAIPVVNAGVITGVQITSPGQNYSPGDSVTFTFTGAGATSSSNTYTTSLAGLTAPNGGGGLTKQGAGTLRLAASNTYTGPTKITGGTLQLTNVGSPVSVPNYSFETPQYGNTVNYDPTGANWNFSGHAGITDGYGFSFSGVSPPDGRQAGMVQDSGYFNQNINFPAAGSYTLSFYTEQRPGSQQVLGVDLDTPYSSPANGIDLSNGGFIPGANWGLVSYTFTETAGSHLLTFVGETSGTPDYTAYVDDVTLTQNVVGASSYIPSASPVVISDNATFDVNGDAQAIGSLSGTPLSSVLLGIGTLTTGNDGTSTTFAGVISGAGSVVKVGSGTQTLSGSNTYAGGTNVSGGKLVLSSVAGSTPLPANSAVTVGSGATLQIANHSIGSSSYVPTLSSLNNTGTIDITNNAMILHNGTIGTTFGQIAAAYNNGNWNGGSGSAVITSSTAAADPTHLTAVGVATGDVVGSVGTVSVSSTDVVVKYTYYGDANLDGLVNSVDYTLIDSGFLSGTLTGWQNGDFNYDRVINGSDYTLIDNAFNMQGATISNQIAAATAQIAGTTAVPEPTAITIVAIGFAGLLGRSRRLNRR